MISLKPCVKISKLQPQILLAWMIWCDLCRQHNMSAVISAGEDGKHQTSSKHYIGQALDFRTKHLGSTLRDALVSDLKQAAGENYDIVVEDVGGDNEHGHMEYDPK